MATRLNHPIRSTLRGLAVAIVFWLALVSTVGCGSVHAAPAPTPTATTAPTQTPAPTETPRPTATPRPVTPEEIVDQLSPSVVMLVAKIGDDVSSGTGFTYDRTGLIVTNAHVIEGAAFVRVYFNGSSKPYTAQIMGRSTCTDLAVLKVDAPNLVPVKIGDSDHLKVGEEVIALGYPLARDIGEDLSFASGRVRRLHQEDPIWRDAIEHAAPINPGNSGGPLVNLRGEVVGINAGSRRNAQNTNYAISAAARPIIKTLASGKDKEWIGMELITNSPDLAKKYGLATSQGMVVVAVTPGSPADQVGLLIGDIVYRMEGTEPPTLGAVCEIVKTRRAGDTIKLEVVRGKKVLTGYLKVR